MRDTLLGWILAVALATVLSLAGCGQDQPATPLPEVELPPALEEDVPAGDEIPMPDDLEDRMDVGHIPWGDENASSC